MKRKAIVDEHDRIKKCTQNHLNRIHDAVFDGLDYKTRSRDSGIAVNSTESITLSGKALDAFLICIKMRQEVDTIREDLKFELK